MQGEGQPVSGGQDRTRRIPLRNGRAAVDVDLQTGLPVALDLPDRSGRARVELATSVSLLVGGGEQRPLSGGLEYPGSTWLREGTVTGLNAGRAAAPLSSETQFGGWSAALDFEVRPLEPRLRMSMSTWHADGADRPLRNAEIEFRFGLPGMDGWLLHAPGNRLRPATPLAALEQDVTVATIGGNLGSPGLIALDNPGEEACLVLWAFSRTEIGQLTIMPTGTGLTVRISTDLAGDPLPGTALSYSGVFLDLISAPWACVRPRIRSWLAPAGLRSPGVKPDWARAAAIYEVQPGRSVFSNGYSYEPYHGLADITRDLPRIADLGFTAIQIMPCHPYPSYNVHDYADVKTTYGPERDLMALVSASHAHGLRVILDVVMHGVIDRQAVATAVRSIEQSGVLEQPPTEPCDVFAGTPASWQALQRAWCQHVMDFAPYWLAGAPPVHPLTERHPDWFCRDSGGRITGIYTEAFDLASEGWQEYFCAQVVLLAERFNIDGFRFDAPTYNNFANWAPARRARASASTMASVALFERLRPRLKALRPDLMMFTEPSGLVHRESMDVNYNYDELWLIPAVTAPNQASQPLTGAEMAKWMEERNALLPLDAVTAHHSDSHDTFWWPQPGHKWRREQLGSAPARAWMHVMALCGGAFLMFTGGETAIQDAVRRTLHLRQQHPELSLGESRFDAVSTDRDEIFAVVRGLGRAISLVLVNMSAERITATCTLAPEFTAPHPVNYYSASRNVQALGPQTLAAELGPFDLALVALQRRA